MATRTPISTDDFNRTTLGANWTNINTGSSSISIINDTRVYGIAVTGIGTIGAALWAGAGSFSNDQYASVECQTGWFGTGYGIGPAVRMSGSEATRNYYAVILQGNANSPALSLVKMVGGTNTVLHTTNVSWTSGHTLELEVEGTSLRVYINGVHQPAYDTTDADLTTGVPGVVGSGSTQFVSGDNWIGGNLGGAAPTITGDITHAHAVAAGAMTYTAATVTVAGTQANGRELRDENQALITSGTVSWEWYDKTTDTTGNPLDSGTFTPDANGEWSISPTGSTLLTGQSGTLILELGTKRGIYELTVVRS